MQGIWDFLTGPFCTFIWQGILLPCVFVAGALFTVQTGGLQIFRFPTVVKETVGSLFRKPEREEKQKGKVTPFRALCTALAGTVGTGSVVGTCQAVALGGPGALFWLWVAAFFGMIIKFFEVTLAIRFRKKRSDGTMMGGPMYYILLGMGERARLLAVLYALFALLSSFGMGCLAQANSVGFGVENALEVFFTVSSPKAVAVLIGALMAFVLASALRGGAGRVGRMAELLVPFITLLFVGVTAIVIFCHREKIPDALAQIFRGAFHQTPFWGAASGIGMKSAIEWGLKRSAFSNEAGLGSAAIAHACAETDSPVRQGFFGVFEVFIDTLVICSLTGFTVLVALPTERIGSYVSPDATLITEAVATVFGNSFAKLFLGISLALFAFSTLLGWSLYGSRCAGFLFGSLGEKGYRMLFVFFTFLGSFIAIRPVWDLSDLFNGLMAIPNFIALFALSGTVLTLTHQYFEKNKNISQKDLTQTSLCDKLNGVGSSSGV